MSIRNILKRSRYPGTYREGWLGGDNVERIKNLAELNKFFADWTDKYRFAMYDDLHFQAEYRGALWPLWTFLLGLWSVVFDRLRFFKSPGIHVQVWLPRSLGLDLYLTSRRRVSPHAGNFYAHFRVDTASRGLFEEFCTEEFKDALLSLRDSCHIRMTDNFIQVGPFSGSPQESARALDLLITTVPRPSDSETIVPDYFAAVENDEGAVVVKVASSTLEADLWSSMLLGEGIPCTMLGYEQSRVWGNTPGFSVKILVPKSYAEQAEEVLSAEADLEEESGL